MPTWVGGQPRHFTVYEWLNVKPVRPVKGVDATRVEDCKCEWGGGVPLSPTPPPPSPSPAYTPPPPPHVPTLQDPHTTLRHASVKHNQMHWTRRPSGHPYSTFGASPLPF